MITLTYPHVENGSLRDKMTMEEAAKKCGITKQSFN